MKLKHFKSRLGDGLWLGVPADVYHKHPGISSTGIRTLLASPLTFHREATGQIRREPTDAMRFGTAAHSAILENRFDAFHIQPAQCADGSDWHNSKKECKAWNETHADKCVLTAKQAAELSEAAKYIREHPKASRLLCEGGHAEVSAIVAGHKARFDYLTTDKTSARIIDFKTCADANTPAFGREILNRGYHIQAAWYRRVLKSFGFETVQFFFVALQKGPLPLVNVWELTTPAMDLGEMRCATALDLMVKCRVNQHWPEWSDFDGSNEIKTIDVPEWSYPEPELTGAEDI